MNEEKKAWYLHGPFDDWMGRRIDFYFMLTMAGFVFYGVVPMLLFNQPNDFMVYVSLGFFFFACAVEYLVYRWLNWTKPRRLRTLSDQFLLGVVWFFLGIVFLTMPFLANPLFEIHLEIPPVDYGMDPEVLFHLDIPNPLRIAVEANILMIPVIIFCSFLLFYAAYMSYPIYEKHAHILYPTMDDLAREEQEYLERTYPNQCGSCGYRRISHVPGGDMDCWHGPEDIDLDDECHCEPSEYKKGTSHQYPEREQQ